MRKAREYSVSHELQNEGIDTATLLQDECSALEIGVIHIFLHCELQGLDIYENYKFNQAERGAIKTLYEKGFLIES